MMHLFIMVIMAGVVSTLGENSCSDEDACFFSEQCGPETWGDIYPSCNGEKQSPIDLSTDDSVVDQNFEPLKLHNYNKPITKANITNKGDTVMFYPTDNVRRYFTVRGTKYYLKEFHFHWGNKSNDGTEHSLNGQKYALEVHFVHVNWKREFAGLAYLCEETQSARPKFKPITQVLRYVDTKGRSTHLRSDIDLQGLVGKKNVPIYIYNGSLTTPPCTEGVLWLVAREKLGIGKNQLTEFRKVKGCDDKPMTGNVRPLQPLNDRTVYRSN